MIIELKRAAVIACTLALSIQVVLADPSQHTANNVKTINTAFLPGEKLTYSVSWSKVLQAGIAVMEVRNGKAVDGRQTYHFISRTNSVGMVDAVYPVNDMVESMVDVEDMYSIAFLLKESHGSKKREREMLFDPANSTVTVIRTAKKNPFPYPSACRTRSPHCTM